MSSLKRGPVLEVALVNNMPDAALAATAAQFFRLVRAAAGDSAIRWRCYALPGLQRTEKARHYLSRSHENIEALYRRGADVLIVTGCEPRADRIEDEPYWPDMQRLVDWARENTRSTIWSCLSAHAAALHLAGVERRPLPRKISGVYRFEGSASFAGRPCAARIVPHSRCNGLARETLERRGFTVCAHSSEVGVDMFWRREPSLFLFLQGHPEYDADTLVKEYRRDIQRFLDGARQDYPKQPENVFEPAMSRQMDALRERLERTRETTVAPTLSDILSMQNLQAPWADDSTELYRDWLASLGERGSTPFDRRPNGHF